MRGAISNQKALVPYKIEPCAIFLLRTVLYRHLVLSVCYGADKARSKHSVKRLRTCQFEYVLHLDDYGISLMNRQTHVIKAKLGLGIFLIKTEIGRLRDVCRMNEFEDEKHFLCKCQVYDDLTHWGRVTHICVSEIIIIGSENGLSPGRRQAIIHTNAETFLIRPLEINFSEILKGPFSSDPQEGNRWCPQI